MNIINQGCRFDNERKLGENWMGMRGGEGRGRVGRGRGGRMRGDYAATEAMIMKVSKKGNGV